MSALLTSRAAAAYPLPQWEDYDLVTAGMSGGKDSAALALWLWYESGCPHEKLLFYTTDTGNEDALTYAFLDLLRQHFPIQVIVPTRRPKGEDGRFNLYDLARMKGRFPSTKARFCTEWLKIIPARDFIQGLLAEHKNILRVNGVRRDEGHISNMRGAAAVWDWDDGTMTRLYRPLLFWSLEDVWRIHRRYISAEDIRRLIYTDEHLSDEHKEDIAARIERSGMYGNPLYNMGASRVGCYPCINSRKGEIRSMATYRPERIEFLAEQEESVTTGLNGFHSFFSRTIVPVAHRSREIQTVEGGTLTVPTIHDVVEWSKTARGGKQYDMDFEDLESGSACAIGGECE